MPYLLSTDLKRKSVGIAAMMVLGSTLSVTTSANASTLRVTVESLAPANGVLVTPVWFSFHDGSFDSFNPGEPASTGIMSLAEDGITGLEGTVPGVVDFLLNNGLNPADIPDLNDTIGGIFTNSTAAANGGVQEVVIDPTLPIGFLPGQTLSVDIKINNHAQSRFFSYGAMFFPSNDAFIANDDPFAFQIFDANGNFLGADFIVGRNDIWDAGTEVNTETPADVPYTVDVIGDGTDQGGVVALHSGFLAPGNGGVLDFNDGQFANADFTNNPNFQVARITITQVPEPSATLGLFAFAGVGVIGRVVLQKLFKDK